VQILGGLKTENAASSAARWQQELVRLEKQQSELREKPTNKKIAAERESRPRFRAPN
jgi:hypothetical protein